MSLNFVRRDKGLGCWDKKNFTLVLIRRKYKAVYMGERAKDYQKQLTPQKLKNGQCATESLTSVHKEEFYLINKN